MQLIKIEVKESFDRAPVYIFTVLDHEKNESLDFYTPEKVDRVTLTKKGIVLILKSGEYSKFMVPFWDKKVVERLAGLCDRVIGPGTGLKLVEYYSNISATDKEKEKFKTKE